MNQLNSLSKQFVYSDLHATDLSRLSCKIEYVKISQFVKEVESNIMSHSSKLQPFMDENKIIRIPRPRPDPEAEKRRPPPYNPETVDSIFRGLHASGENFYIYKKKLEKVRTDVETIRDKTTNQMKELEPSSESDRDSVVKINSLDFAIKPPRQIKYKSRPQCSTEEEKVISEACTSAGKSSQEMEDIKYALGFKSSDDSKSEFRRPCIACVGQIKAGKSSVINCILKERTVPQRTTRLTARITTITYSETKFVGHVGRNRKLQSLELDQDCRVKDVELPYQDRLDKNKVNIEIRVGRKNKILKNGFDLVDSPGLNENEVLNDLCATMEHSLMPLIVYVICGRQGVTEADVKDIRKIKDRSPELRIIYYVTKLDRSKYDKLQYEDWRKEANLSHPDEHIKGESPMDVAHRRLKKVFKRLQSSGFLPASEKWDSCREFFGASLHDVNAMRHFRPVDDPRTEIDHFNNQQYDRFERYLMLHLKEMIDSPLNEDIKFIQMPVETISEKLYMITSDKEVQNKREKLKCLTAFKEKEQSVYNDKLSCIQEELEKEIGEMIRVNREHFIYVADWYEYSNGLRSQMISEKGNKDRYVSLLKSYRQEIMDTILRSLNEQLKLLVREYISSKENCLRKQLWDVARIIGQETITHCPSFSATLKNRLFYEYEFYEDMNITNYDDYPQNRCEVISNRIIRIVNKLLGRELTSRIPLRCDDDYNLPDPEESEWRKITAEKILDSVDQKTAIKRVSEKISQLFTQRHESFQNFLEEFAKFIELDVSVTEEEVACLKMYEEDLRLQSLICLDVHTSINLIIDNVKAGQEIFKNDAFEVNKLHTIDHQEDTIITEKTFRQKIELESPQFREKLSREIYFASRIIDPRFEEFFGAHLSKQNDGKYQLTLFYPFTEDNSLQNYLESNDVSLKERLQIAIEISNGIKILHALRIIHGNLSMKTILVQEKPDKSPLTKIKDFGISKYFSPPSKESDDASLVYTAPEILIQSDNLSEKADVFSFGVLFWQLMTYKMNTDCDNFDPKYVDSSDKEKIVQAILHGERPQYRKGTPDQLWQLMQACWHQEANNRPSFIAGHDDIPNTLVSYLRDLK